MTKAELLNMLTRNAKEYRKGAMQSIKRNNHMNNATGEKIRQDDIDALLVDFINYVGVCQGIDYGLYTEDFYKEDI
jgi:hypothetical protein